MVGGGVFGGMPWELYFNPRRIVLDGGRGVVGSRAPLVAWAVARFGVLDARLGSGARIPWVKIVENNV